MADDPPDGLGCKRRLRLPEDSEASSLEGTAKSDDRGGVGNNPEENKFRGDIISNDGVPGDEEEAGDVKVMLEGENKACRDDDSTEPERSTENVDTFTCRGERRGVEMGMRFGFTDE